MWIRGSLKTLLKTLQTSSSSGSLGSLLLHPLCHRPQAALGHLGLLGRDQRGPGSGEWGVLTLRLISRAGPRDFDRLVECRKARDRWFGSRVIRTPGRPVAPRMDPAWPHCSMFLLLPTVATTSSTKSQSKPGKI